MYLPVANEARAGMQTGEGVQHAGEAAAAGGEAVELRGLHERMAVAAHGAAAVLVRHDDQQVLRFQSRPPAGLLLYSIILYSNAHGADKSAAGWRHRGVGGGAGRPAMNPNRRIAMLRSLIVGVSLLLGSVAASRGGLAGPAGPRHRALCRRRRHRSGRARAVDQARRGVRPELRGREQDRRERHDRRAVCRQGPGRRLRAAGGVARRDRAQPESVHRHDVRSAQRSDADHAAGLDAAGAGRASELSGQQSRPSWSSLRHRRASISPRRASAPRTIWPANTSTRWPAPSSCTFPIAARRLPSPMRSAVTSS